MGKSVQFMDTHLVLLPERAVWLPAYATLVVADWHLGKASHFRKAGIFMPKIPDHDTARLQLLLATRKARTLVLLGDLFHSDLNSEWIAFERFREANPAVRFILTRGNHDVLPDHLLEKAAVEVVPSYTIGSHIHCTHHPSEPLARGSLNIAGHVHPGCLIPVRGRQAYRLPCFYFHGQTLILPAFGSLTGLQLVKPTADAQIFPIAGNEVRQWNY